VVGYADLVRSLTLDTVLVYVAANLRRLRQQRGMTQLALAEAAEIELRTLQDIEGMRHSVSLNGRERGNSCGTVTLTRGFQISISSG
jgi:DNA-binding XRE family transcriptional regulator